MSYVIDATRKINEFQLQVAANGQNAVVEIVKLATEFADRRPDALRPLYKLVEPVEAVVGTPAEFVRSIAENNAEWSQQWLDFHTKISEVVAPATAPTTASDAGEPTPIKKPGSTRGATNA